MPMYPDQLGKVIRIIDDRTLIVNVGSSFLNVGDEIQVYELGDVLKDLDGKELSYFVFVKDKLDVIDVQTDYSVCKKNKAIVKKLSSAFALSPLLEQQITEYQPLSVNRDEIQPLTPCDPQIHVGDPIKLA